MRKSLIRLVSIFALLAAAESVSAQPASDPNGDGAVRGAAIGAAAGAVTLLLYYRSLDDDVEAPGIGGPLLGSVGVGAGAGALVGYLLDRFHRTPAAGTARGSRFNAGREIQGQSTGRDSLVNGALIGAAVGTGVAIADYAVDPSEPGNAQVAATAVGIGALVGMGIDALLHDDRAVSVAPALSKRGKSLRVSVRF